MKLISWNINKRVSRQSERIEAIASTGSDIVALQEVGLNVVQELRDRLRKIGLIHNRSTAEPELMIASRWPLSASNLDFDIPRPRKDILSVTVESPHGDIELHNMHMPNKGRSKQDRKKIDTCNGIYKALAITAKRHRILCGDLNIPKKEHPDGSLESFYPRSNQEGRAAEMSVIRGLAEFDLSCTFRRLSGYQTEGYSWVFRRRERSWKFRLDHILSSRSLNVIECDYLHRPRIDGLSDHSIIYAIFDPARN